MSPQAAPHGCHVEVQGCLGRQLFSSCCGGPQATVTIVTSAPTQLHSGVFKDAPVRFMRSFVFSSRSMKSSACSLAWASSPVCHEVCAAVAHLAVLIAEITAAERKRTCSSGSALKCVECMQWHAGEVLLTCSLAAHPAWPCHTTGRGCNWPTSMASCFTCICSRCGGRQADA